MLVVIFADVVELAFMEVNGTEDVVVTTQSLIKQTKLNLLSPQSDSVI